MSPDFLLTFENDEGFKVFVDVGKSSAYAYLVREGEIVADVWLFNRGIPPEEPPWLEDLPPPFQVPIDYYYAFLHADSVIQDDFRVLLKGSESLFRVGIYFRDELLAELCTGAMPGKNRLMKVDCPVAKTMSSQTRLHSNIVD